MTPAIPAPDYQAPTKLRPSDIPTRDLGDFCDMFGPTPVGVAAWVLVILIQETGGEWRRFQIMDLLLDVHPVPRVSEEIQKPGRAPDFRGLELAGHVQPLNPHDRGGDIEFTCAFFEVLERRFTPAGAGR